MPPLEIKDLFQFGVPTGLLVLLLWKGPSVVERLASPFLAAIREGFSKIETAVRESNARWKETLEAMHRENREDIAKDQELRHSTNSVMQDALLTVREQAERLSELKSTGAVQSFGK